METLNTVLRILLAILFVIATASMAAGEDGEPAGIVDTLKFIAFSGLFVGAFISDALEKFDWFNKLADIAKRAVVGAFVTGLPVLAIFLLNVVPDSVWVILEPFWAPLMIAIIGWVGSQFYHFAVNKRRT